MLPLLSLPLLLPPLLLLPPPPLLLLLDLVVVLALMLPLLPLLLLQSHLRVAAGRAGCLEANPRCRSARATLSAL